MLEQKRAFDVTILKTFPNHISLRRIIVISNKMPLPSEFKLKSDERFVEAKEMRGVEVVIK